MARNIFVFVVCGADVHIHTLNFSLPYLKHFSKNEILVVTDLKRNNIEINHDNIVNIDTPEHLDHHQASIYMKTGLFRIVDPGNHYCYLDSDIIAMDPSVDEVFEHRTGPVTFASDHCSMNEFSPYAVKCGCLEDKNGKREIIEKYHNRFNSDYSRLLADQNTRELLSRLQKIKSNPVGNIFTVLRYLFVKFLSKRRYFELDNQYVFDKQESSWNDKKGNLLIYDFSRHYREIESNTEFRFDRLRKRWKDENGRDIYEMKCDHLRQEINKKFNLSISKKKWRHWNGGVFLFDESSTQFLEAWHNSTLDIFNDPNWRTRDQGTLIVTVWQFGLQNQPRIPQKFNFIADFYNPSVQFEEGKGYTNNNWKTTEHPACLHVYHEFGRKDWNIWQDVEAHLEQSKKYKGYVF